MAHVADLRPAVRIALWSDPSEVSCLRGTAAAADDSTGRFPSTVPAARTSNPPALCAGPISQRAHLRFVSLPLLPAPVPPLMEVDARTSLHSASRTGSPVESASPLLWSGASEPPDSVARDSRCTGDTGQRDIQRHERETTGSPQCRSSPHSSAQRMHTSVAFSSASAGAQSARELVREECASVAVSPSMGSAFSLGQHSTQAKRQDGEERHAADDTNEDRGAAPQLAGRSHPFEGVLR